MNIPVTVSENDKYDALKGISIILVVWIHIVNAFFTPQTLPFILDLFRHLTGLAVPFFLILGGFFFGSKFLSSPEPIPFSEILNTLKKNVFKRLIVPYYIFVVILTLYNAISGKTIFWQHFFFIDSNEHGLYYIIIYTYSFVFSLSLIYALGSMRIGTKAVVISLASLVFYVICKMEPLKNVFKDSVVFNQLPLISFFCFGIILNFAYSYMKNNIKIYKQILGTFLSILLFLGIIFTARKIFGPFEVFTAAPPTIYRLFYSLLSFLFFLSLLSIPSLTYFFKRILITEFGKNSLMIFLLHPYLVKALHPLSIIVFNQYNINYHSNYFVIPVVTSSCIIVLLSLKLIHIMPESIKKLFNR